MQIEHFQIADRFCGPPRSGNGGYTCGLIAKQLSGGVSVRLKAPPPLHTELRLESSENGAQLFHGSTLIGEARCVQLELQPPPSPSFVQAEKAAHLFSRVQVAPIPRLLCVRNISSGSGRLAHFSRPIGKQLNNCRAVDT